MKNALTEVPTTKENYVGCPAKLAGFLHLLGAASAIRVASFGGDYDRKPADLALKGIAFFRHFCLLVS